MIKIRSARLIFTEICNRNCNGCVNHQYDFSKYPSWDWGELDCWDEVVITGGEPLLYWEEVTAFLQKIQYAKRPPNTIVYTAKTDNIGALCSVLDWVDGLTVTLHESADIKDFLSFNRHLIRNGPYNKSLRLSVFKNVIKIKRPLALWKIKKDIAWINNCPLPSNESLRVLR